jgi:hypothetical protein
MTSAERAVVAAVCIACGYATVVGLVVADRIITPKIQARALRKAQR